MRVLINPEALITTPGELAAVTRDYAERRIRFSQHFLRGSPLDTVLAFIEETQTRYDWSEAGVSKSDVSAFDDLGFDERRLHTVIAHPKRISAAPASLGYYQRLLSMSGKVFPRLFPALAPLGRAVGPMVLSPEQRNQLTELNALLVRAVLTTGLTPVEAIRTVIRSEGASVDGDWRNQTGRIALWRTLEAIEGALEDQVPLIVSARRNKVVVGLGGRSAVERAELEDDRFRPAEILAPGRFRIRFGSQTLTGAKVDADITVARTSSDDQPVEITAVGEVKGTSDPANAKERWRIASANVASMSALRLGRRGARPSTFYVGNVLDKLVISGDRQVAGMSKLLDDGVLDEAFSVLKFASEPAERGRFREFLRAQLRLEPER